MNDFKNAKIADGLPSSFYYNEPPLPFGFVKESRARRRQGKGILSKEDVKEIRFRYDNAEKTNDIWFGELAEEFDVSISCVKDCARRKTFKDE